jgi:hypothetical protein
VVCMLASGTQIVGSNPAEAVEFFGRKKSSACLPSEGKYSLLSHVADLRHVKEPCRLSWKSGLAGKIPRTFLARFHSSLTGLHVA